MAKRHSFRESPAARTPCVPSVFAKSPYLADADVAGSASAVATAAERACRRERSGRSLGTTFGSCQLGSMTGSRRSMRSVREGKVGVVGARRGLGIVDVLSHHIERKM